jgi:hypothetical protein
MSSSTSCRRQLDAGMDFARSGEPPLLQPPLGSVPPSPVSHLQDLTPCRGGGLMQVELFCPMDAARGEELVVCLLDELWRDGEGRGGRSPHTPPQGPDPFCNAPLLGPIHHPTPVHCRRIL